MNLSFTPDPETILYIGKIIEQNIIAKNHIGSLEEINEIFRNAGIYVDLQLGKEVDVLVTVSEGNNFKNLKQLFYKIEPISKPLLLAYLSANRESTQALRRVWNLPDAHLDLLQKLIHMDSFRRAVYLSSLK